MMIVYDSYVCSECSGQCNNNSCDKIVGDMCVTSCCLTLVVIVIILTHVASANDNLLHVKLLKASAYPNWLNKHVS